MEYIIPDLTSISTWIGMFSLILLEIILSVDNIIFIAVIIEKVQPQKRDIIRLIGLCIALLMRLLLLILISWVSKLDSLLLTINGFHFSIRNLILLLGGLLLLFKASTELHDRLNNNNIKNNKIKHFNNVAFVIIQIVIIDTIFSLDSIITAIGIVNNLIIMIISIIISTIITLLTSREVTNFIDKNSNVIVLCLSFLLMIGFNLIVEGCGIHIPKSYLYTAMSFSILIEMFNQIAKKNFIKKQSQKSVRERITETIIKLINNNIFTYNINYYKSNNYSKKSFSKEEYSIIKNFLTLSKKKVNSIMTPHDKIIWLDINKSNDELISIILNTSHNIFPVCNGNINHIIGIARAKDLFIYFSQGGELNDFIEFNSPMIIISNINIVILLKKFKKSKNKMILISDNNNITIGLITPSDILKLILYDDFISTTNL